jgi:hypothetical protein
MAAGIPRFAACPGSTAAAQSFIRVSTHQRIHMFMHGVQFRTAGFPIDAIAGMLYKVER